MTDPYFTSHSLYSEFQKAYESVMSSNGLVFKDFPQPSGLVFGLRVDQTVPSNYLNAFITYGERFPNSLSDCRLKLPVRVIYSPEFQQSEPLYLSHKPKAYQQAEQTTKIPASRSELRIDRVWGMAGEASSHSYSVNANPPPLTSTLENTAGSSLSGVKVSASGSGESLNFSHGKPYQKAYAQPEIRSVSKQATQSGKGWACAQSEKRKAYQRAYEKTEKRKAYQKAYQKVYQKAYRHSEKRKAYMKAYMKAYAKTEKRKAYLKACAQSGRERAAKRAYVQSEKGKTSKQAWEQSQERKALQKAAHEIFKHTNDKEQEKITGKQAAVFIRELNNAKNNEL